MKNSTINKVWESITNPIITVNPVQLAQSIKDYFINLAINDNLPLDLNELNITEIQNIIYEHQHN